MEFRQSLRLAHSDINEIIAAFYHVYNKLGGQLAESIYAGAMPVALRMRGLNVQSEVPYVVMFEGVAVGTYRIDLVVAETFIVELKSVEKLLTVHEAQVYNYLRITQLPVGLLFNFGPSPQHRRLVVPSKRRL